MEEEAKKVPKGFPDSEAMNFFARLFKVSDVSGIEALIAVKRIAHNLIRSTEAYFSKFGISSGGFRLMMLLLRRGRIAPAEMADCMDVSRATITGLIDTLANLNYITREPDQNDRRVILVSLTDAGRAKLEEFLPIYYEHISKTMQPFSAAERKQLINLMYKLNDSLNFVQDTEGN